MTLTNENRAGRIEEDAVFSISPLVPAGLVKRELQKLRGVNDVSINHLAQTVQVKYDPKKVTSDKIRAFVKTLDISNRRKNRRRQRNRSTN